MPQDTEKQNAEKYKLNYGSSVISVPGAVLTKLKAARKQDLIILMALASRPEADIAEIEALAECDSATAESAIAFWRGAGIVLCDDEEPAAPAETAKPKKKTSELTSVPMYSAEEVAGITDGNPAIGSMIDECERILGRMFGQTDSMRMVSVIEYFGLEPEYMMLACAHCAGCGQKSVGYVLKMVSSLCDRGITTVEALNDYLFSIENFAKLEMQIRQLFGMNMSRELSEKEKNILSEWTDKYGYGLDIIKKAYNITIDSIGEPSLNYANAVMSKWYTQDLKTAEQIDAFLAAEKGKKKSTEPGKSFNSEDFFTAALARSYGQDANVPKADKTDGKERRNYGVKPGKA